MPDPFRPDPKAQLLREAQVGLMVVGVMLALFLYVAFYKISGRGRKIPDHVRNAPIAKMVQTDAVVQQTSGPDLQRTRQEAPSQTQWPSPKPLVADGLENRPRLPLKNESVAEKSVVATRIPPDGPKLKPLTDKGTSRSKTDKNSSTSGITRSLAGLLGKLKPADPASKRGPDSSSKTSSNATESKSPNPKSNNYEVVDVQPFADPKSVAMSTVSPPTESKPAKPSLADNAGPRNNNELTSKVRLTSAESSDNAVESNDNAFEANEKFTPAPRLERTPAQLPTTPNSTANKIRSNNQPFRLTEDTRRTNRQSNNEFQPGPQSPAADAIRSPKEHPPGSLTHRIQTTQLGANAQVTPNDVREVSVKEVYPSMEPTVPLRLPATQRPGRSNLPAQVDIANSDAPPPAADKFTSRSESPHPELLDPSDSMTHVVGAGESFWSIAQERYGDGQYFRALYQHNRSTSPELSFEVIPGTTLTTPELTDLRRLWPSLCPRKSPTDAMAQKSTNPAEQQSYVTEDGDTLFEIARQKLGQASRYLEIQQLSQPLLDGKISSDTPLPAGLRLVLPAQ